MTWWYFLFERSRPMGFSHYSTFGLVQSRSSNERGVFI